MTTEHSHDEVVDHVAWALHCWSCPLCYVDGFAAMAASDQDHVIELDRLQAAFLVGTLGLTYVADETSE